MSCMETNEKTPFRPMRRARQELPREECLEIIEKAPRGILSVIGDGGYPYSLPINYYHEDGKLYFHSAKEGHKLDALRACDKACFTVLDEPVKEPDDWWYHVKSVICFGRLREVTEEPLRMDMLRKFGMRYFPEVEELEKELRHSSSRAAVLEFTIEHMTGKKIEEK